MKSTEATAEPAKEYRAKEYWTALAQGASSTDVSAFAPVLHPHAPAWFNRLIDDLQFRAIRRALAIGGVHHGARMLDVGCGTGRWVRRYQELGLAPIGVDATLTMLRLARERGETVPLVAGEAGHLPFADEQFDVVSDITVIQHIPTSIQTHALNEMTRVLKTGGRLILMELIRGEGAHIFPRTAQGWIEQATSHGLKLCGWFGQEYALLDRLLVHTAQAITAKRGGYPVSATEILEKNHRRWPSSATRRLFWALRHVTAPISAWTDPIVERICPREAATHGVFVLQK
jgi:ubiquinone/menaquinone biosynthesis C-methylase UbiE